MCPWVLYNALTENTAQGHKRDDVSHVISGVRFELERWTRWTLDWFLFFVTNHDYPLCSSPVPRTMTCARIFLISSLVFGGVLASLYPTSPVADTVYDAGRQNLVEWIDDDPLPHLNEISVLKVDLYHDNDVCLSSLSWSSRWLM